MNQKSKTGFGPLVAFSLFSFVGFMECAHAEAPAAGSNVSIPCLEGNAVKNATADQVCKAILPKCSDLKSDLEKNVKNLMQWKIWGYYQGIDLNLAQSSTTNLVGETMATNICSVAGHKLQNTPQNQVELMAQSVGENKSCGVRPNFPARRVGQRLGIQFENPTEPGKPYAGSLWNSYLNGGYQWLIRAITYDILKEIKPDLSNLNTVIETSSMSNDLVQTINRMHDFSMNLSAEAKASCIATDSNLTSECLSGAISINDPAHKVCTIVKSQLALNTGALPNMVAYEVMARVMKRYDELFGNIINFSNPTAASMKSACGDTDPGFGSINRRRKMNARAGACWMGKRMCATNSNVGDSPGAGVCRSWNRRISLTNGRVGGGAPTINLGFASVVESIIRRDICGQRKISDPSKCDEVGIPTEKPVNPLGGS